MAGTSMDWCYPTIKLFSSLTSRHSTEHVGGCSKFCRGHLHGKKCSNQNVTSLQRLVFPLAIYLPGSLKGPVSPPFLHCSFNIIGNIKMLPYRPLNKKYPTPVFLKMGYNSIAFRLCQLHLCNFKAEKNTAAVVWHGNSWFMAPLELLRSWGHLNFWCGDSNLHLDKWMLWVVFSVLHANILVTSPELAAWVLWVGWKRH